MNIELIRKKTQTSKLRIKKAKEEENKKIESVVRSEAAKIAQELISEAERKVRKAATEGKNFARVFAFHESHKINCEVARLLIDYFVIHDFQAERHDDESECSNYLGSYVVVSW